MITIVNITSAQASTYYQKDNYYIKSEGEWQGKGAEYLSLQNEVKKEDFEKILDGSDVDGNQLITKGGNTHKHRPGMDLTFSAPKSVSVASEVMGDTNIRRAHENAVKEALKYAELHFSYARQTENGVTTKIHTGNFVIATFTHDTSRELDPQLHTHAVIANMTQRPDGQWRALSNEPLHENVNLLGQIYRNELAKNLVELGYSVNSNSKGMFEIQGIDEKILQSFSQRTTQINEKVLELQSNSLYSKADYHTLRDIATLASRKAKQNVDISEVRESWLERLQEQGYTKEIVKQSIENAFEQSKQHDPNKVKQNEYDYVRAAARIQTENSSTFTKEEILNTAGKLSVGEYTINQLQNAFLELCKDAEFKTLGKNVFTTAEMQKIERNILTKIKQGHGAKEPINKSKESFLKSHENLKLTQGQKNAVNHILNSTDRYIAVQGDAGTGKTTMLSFVKEQIKSYGYEIRGLSFTGKAASEIKAQTGISSQTIDSFLANKANNILRGKELWVVDESSMLGSRKMNQLITAAEKEDARIVFIGDTKQLQPVEAGGMFVKLQSTGVLKTAYMKEVLRQTNKNYKDIVSEMSEKRIDIAFRKLESDGRIYEISNRHERLKAIQKDFISRDFKKTVIITATNADRNELNKVIRHELMQQGKLSPEEYTFIVRKSANLTAESKHFAQSYKEGDVVFANKLGILGKAGTEGKIAYIDRASHQILVVTPEKTYTVDLKSQGQHLSVFREKEQSFSKGDKIIFLKNDKGREFKNGLVGVVQSINKDGDVKIKLENNEIKNVNLATQYNYIDYGYAVTDYKSQGQTSVNVIYHADTTKGVNYNQAYVAITRGKEDIQIYTDDKEMLQNQMKNEQNKTSTLDYKTIENEKEEIKKESISKDDEKSKEKDDEKSREKDDEKSREKDIELSL